nr:SET domain-containing protein SmydA-8-like isoform X2 [Lepeophtheirus salmonis]
MNLCSKCNFPVCNEICATEGKWHAPLECSYFQSKGFKAASISEAPEFGKIHKLLLQIAAITPLRFLLLNESQHWNQERNLHYSKIIRKDKSFFLEKDMSKTIMEDFDVDYDESVISQTLRQIFNNAKSLEKNGNDNSGLYFLYSLMNHNCISNTKSIIHCVKDDSSPAQIDVRALRPIKAGEEISTRYVSSNMGLPTRRELLLEHWGFTCNCSRCKDPSELGTYTSAIKCSSCQSGYFLPSLDLLKEWSCNSCSKGLSKIRLQMIINENTEKIRTATRSQGPKIDVLKELIVDLKDSLHGNHFLILQVEYILVVLMSNSIPSLSSSIKNKNITINNIDPSIWKEYTALCEHIYYVMNKLDPGYSKNRGKILKDYIRALMNLAKIENNLGSINNVEFNKRKEMAKYFSKELIGCYKHEKFSSSKMKSNGNSFKL